MVACTVGRLSGRRKVYMYWCNWPFTLCITSYNRFSWGFIEACTTCSPINTYYLDIQEHNALFVAFCKFGLCTIYSVLIGHIPLTQKTLNIYPIDACAARNVTARGEPWPFFFFWRHHVWPKLASSMLNFCRRKRSFQWCPDQSDRPIGALDMHKNAQKVEWKTRSKISCHYTWLLQAKNCPSRLRFLSSFLTATKPSRRLITAAKRREKEKKERRKKNSKNRKP